MKTIDLDSLKKVTGGTAQRVPHLGDQQINGPTIYNPPPPNLGQITADKLWPPVS